MINCQTLIINNNAELDNNGLSIGGLKFKIKNDGSLATTDIDGNENVINNNGNAYGKIKHLEVGINVSNQTIPNNQETQIYFDSGYEISDDADFSVGSDGNSIIILSPGHYFISFNISLDMYNSVRTTVGGYIKTNDNIIEKSISYSYFHNKEQGFGSINNSFIYDATENDEITLHVKTKEGSGKFYSVPESTNFNIFRIE